LVYIVERSLDDIMSFEPYRSAVIYGKIYDKQISVMVELTGLSKLSILDILFYNCIIYNNKSFYYVRNGVKTHRIDPFELANETIKVTDFTNNSIKSYNLFENKTSTCKIINVNSLIDKLLPDLIGQGKVDLIDILKIKANNIYFNAFNTNTNPNILASKSASIGPIKIDTISTNYYRWIKNDFSFDPPDPEHPYKTKDGKPSWIHQIDLEISDSTIAAILTHNPPPNNLNVLKFEILNVKSNLTEDTIVTF
jgi:hypothetical protein